MLNKFVEIPASKMSIVKRKLVFGIGINNADYVVKPEVNGKQVTCKFYVKWCDMLRRCYSSKLHEKFPTYKDCIVCAEWIYFSNFKAWMESEDWRSKDLDKDLIYPGNKIYSPKSCCFISRSLNTLMLSNKVRRGEFPLGVSWHKKTKKFISSVNYNGSSIYLGLFEAVELASNAYTKKKVEIILEAANGQTDQRIANGLRMHAKMLQCE